MKKSKSAEQCMFCESYMHCSDAHPFNTLNDLINDIHIGMHIPCGISEKNSERIRNEIRQAFRTFLAKQYFNAPELVEIKSL